MAITERFITTCSPQIKGSYKTNKTVELIKYGLNPINDGLDNYAIVWSKKKTEFFNCTEGHVCNYKKYLTEIVNSWVVVGANKWCIENVHSDSEVSECVASLKKNEMGSESGSENYFNSFLRFFMEATEIPSNLKTYAAKYFAFLHIKSSELKILKTTPWCSGESGYQGFTCIDRLDVHFKQLGRTFLAPILYVRHIIEHMVPKFISDPQVREFIDYLFNSIKDQLGVSMIPLKYCELFDIEVQQSKYHSMNKNGLSLRSIYAAFNRIYYNLSLDTVKEIYIQHYIKYVVMNVLVDDKKLIKGTDAVSWCTFKNNPSMFDNISQNQTKNATETSEKSKEILKDVSKEILKDVSKEILKDASKETPVKKSSVEIPLNLSTEKNTVKDSQEETPLRPSVSEPVISQIKNLSADERKKMYFGSIQKNTPIEPNEDQSKSRFQFLKNPLEIVKEVERKLQQPSKYYSDFMANPIETAKNTFLRFTTFQDDFVNDDKF
ncbi:Hypothetical protein CINCED_3A009194 [Cinara cedri]|uniref:Uncharacterized protein n=1 Tax=Cinara cedri TaxID=506608 RepID=A0A5E4NHF5_9HEMI|nr:Hypothetical protein CINCED_3A009194 [Cinara cedri]